MIQLSAELAHVRDAEQPDPFCSPGFIERNNQAYAADTPLTDRDWTTWRPT